MPHLGDPAGDDELPIDPDLAPGDPAEPRTDHERAARPATRARRRAEPSVLGAIALGGALGAPARYGVAPEEAAKVRRAIRLLTSSLWPELGDLLDDDDPQYPG